MSDGIYIIISSPYINNLIHLIDSDKEEDGKNWKFFFGPYAYLNKIVKFLGIIDENNNILHSDNDIMEDLYDLLYRRSIQTEGSIIFKSKNSLINNAISEIIKQLEYYEFVYPHVLNTNFSMEKDVQCFRLNDVDIFRIKLTSL